MMDSDDMVVEALPPHREEDNATTLADEPPAPLTIDAADSLETILTALKSFPDVASIQAQGCEALARLATPSSSSLSSASSLLARLFAVTDNKTQIRQAGGVPLLIAALHKHKGVASVQEQARNALLLILPLQETDGVHKIVETMIKYSALDFVQEHGCRTLVALTSAEGDYMARSEIRLVGGIPVVLSLIRTATTNRQSTGLLMAACSVLRNITVNATNRERVANEGGIPVMVEAFNGCEEESFQAQCCEILGYLAYDNEATRRLIAESGGIQAVVSAMGQPTESLTLQTEACKTLRNIATNNPSNCRLIAKTGGLSQIVDFMKQHPSSPTVEFPVGALIALATDAEVLEQFSEAGVLEIILQVTEANPEVRVLQARVFGMLIQFLEHPQLEAVLRDSAATKLGKKAATRFPSLRQPRTFLEKLGVELPPSETLVSMAPTAELSLKGVIRRMRENEMDERVQEHGCRDLDEMTSDYFLGRENRRDIINAGGVPLLLAVQENYLNSPIIQQHVLPILAKLKLAPSISNFDSIESIVDVLQLYSTVTSVQEQGCRVLRNRSCYYTDDDRAKIADSGGIPVMISAMQQHVDSLRIQEDACAVLRYVTADDTRKGLLAEFDGVSAIVSSMNRHTGSLILHEHACSCLHGFAVKDNSSVRCITAADGISAIVSSMKRHDISATVQEHALATLAVLAHENVANQLSIAETGVIPSIVANLRGTNHPRSVIENTCAVLCNLSAYNAANQRSIAHEGGVLWLVKTIQDCNHGEPKIQSAAIGALVNLTAAPENQALFVNPNIVRVFAEMLAADLQSSVHVTVCWAVTNLVSRGGASDTENEADPSTVMVRQCFTNANGIRAIVRSMKRHADSAALQQHACDALFWLASDVEVWQKLWGSNCIQAIQAAIKAHPESKDVQKQAFALLSKMINVKAAVLCTGVAELAKEAQVRFPSLEGLNEFVNELH
jgi:hypothetical protein